jgi:hypothetical protein
MELGDEFKNSQIPSRMEEEEGRGVEEEEPITRIVYQISYRSAISQAENHHHLIFFLLLDRFFLLNGRDRSGRHGRSRRRGRSVIPILFILFLGFLRFRYSRRKRSRGRRWGWRNVLFFLFLDLLLNHSGCAGREGRCGTRSVERCSSRSSVIGRDADFRHS